jgi:hypothetical protein
LERCRAESRRALKLVATGKYKNLLSFLTILFFACVHLCGCATTYGRYDPDQKQAVRTLTGGLLGGLVAGNTGGAIVGALIVDIYSITRKDYYDRSIAPRDEAAKKYDYNEKKVELFIEGSGVAALDVRSGSMVESNIQYTILAPPAEQEIRITETRILSSENKRVELDKREVLRKQGTHVSTIKFTIPDDIPRGYCILFTTISNGKHSKTARSVINII